MLQLRWLRAEQRDITDLTGLEYATNLDYLEAWLNEIRDISPLKNLMRLKILNLYGNQIQDITPLANLTNLTALSISINAVENVEPLAGLMRLQTLSLSNNQIVDITPLANLTNLTDLKLSNNQVRDLNPLMNLTALETLRLHVNAIVDITPLANLTNLTELKLSNNQIVDITPLANLTNLTELVVAHNQVRDLNPLMHLTALESLRLNTNAIVDITPLANLTNLTELTVSQNQVRDLNPLAGLTRLTLLNLSDNRISDLTPLMSVTALEILRLNMNAIVDITPLIGLKNLKELWLADNPIRDFSPLAQLVGVELNLVGVELSLDIDLNRLDQLNLVVTIPDLNLERAIRQTLALPDGVSLTQLEMLRLTELEARRQDISDVTGIEYATNLVDLSLHRNRIEDIDRLANLTKLRDLDLDYNAIKSVESLTSLTQLEILGLTGNPIHDITPLANLINLQSLFINETLVTDITPLQALNIPNLYYDKVCDFPPLLPPVRERMDRRTFPSAFAWGGAISTLGLDHLTTDQRAALYDLDFGPGFAVGWDSTPTEPAWGVATSLAGRPTWARETLQRRISQNPNMVFLRNIDFHSHYSDESYPPGSDYFLRDENGEIVRSSSGSPHINFLNSEVQDLLIKRVIGIERCGLYDGIMIDQFANHGAWGHYKYGVSPEEVIQAFANIFKAIREQVRDDFLILINTNRDEATYYTEYVNGSFMEAGHDYVYMSGMPGGFSYDGLKEIESTLSWSEEHLRSPQINCLEGWGIPAEPPDSPENQRWMRVITTLSLTHSDGYVVYTTGWGSVAVCPECPYKWGPAHEQIWYDFWDADLGRPIGPKVQYRQNIEDSFNGLFIRKFTNGWAVYNRSGKAQTITLPASATPVSDRGDNSPSATHLLPDLDGEIYLKPPSPYDLNRDGTINVLDLILVSQHFGTATGDVNGDGTTNILDLTLVAQQFSQ